MADRVSQASAAGRIPAGTPMPVISARTADLSSAKSDLAVCFAFEGGREPAMTGVSGKSPLGSALGRVMKTEGFKGKARESVLWTSVGRFPAGRYLVIGLGKKTKAGLDAVRDGCGLAARKAAAVKARTLSMALPELTAPLGAEAVAQTASEGLMLGSYRMRKYLTLAATKSSPLGAAYLLCGKSILEETRRGAVRGIVRGAATTLTRELVNEPAGSLTPSIMADVAREVAKRGGLAIKVYGKKELAALGMGAILGVSAGSHQPPCVIHLTWKPPAGKKPARRIALVGKGLTFDSGGLSLKTASGMETMKLDKAGASAVLGVMSAMKDLAPNVEVHGILGMTENMPGGSAIKPGDILKTFGGKTIEVLNTDAEGRLVLADLLGYTQQQKVDEIIDLATLTGAVVVALGPVIVGAFSAHQPMMDRLMVAAQVAGEKIWQLPLFTDYADQMRSDIADIKNTSSSRYGGAITAALFLKTFVKDDVPWIHLDIAGPAFFEGEQGYMRKGGTGSMVRTLLTYIESMSEAAAD